MNVKIDNDEFKLVLGEYINTKEGSGIIIGFEEVYENIIININGNRNPVHVSKIISIGKSKSDDKFLNFALASKDELAKKEFVKDGRVKPRLSLLPQLALVEVAKVFTYGANKYDEYNFSQGAKNTTYIDASLRHINKYLCNSNVDDESNLFHLAHAVSNLMMVLDNDLLNKSIENRNRYYEK
jgi:hypothetical protein